MRRLLIGLICLSGHLCAEEALTQSQQDYLYQLDHNMEHVLKDVKSFTDKVQKANSQVADLKKEFEVKGSDDEVRFLDLENRLGSLEDSLAKLTKTIEGLSKKIDSKKVEAAAALEAPLPTEKPGKFTQKKEAAKTPVPKAQNGDLTKAVTLLKQGKIQEAEPILQSLSKQQLSPAVTLQVNYWLGDLHFSKNQFEDAIYPFAVASEIVIEKYASVPFAKEKGPEVFYKLAAALKHEKKTEEALVILAKADSLFQEKDVPMHLRQQIKSLREELKTPPAQPEESFVEDVEEEVESVEDETQAGA